MNEKIDTSRRTPPSLPMIALRGIVGFPNMILHFDVAREMSEKALEAARCGIADSGGRIDYVTALDLDTMEEPLPESKGILIAAAVFYGTTRLIDNEVIEFSK